MTEKNDIKKWFSMMVTDNMDAMFGAALRLTGNRTNAEDLVAETVIKAWSCIDALEDRGRWRSWVFRILRNNFISHYRKQSVRPVEMPFSGHDADDADGISNLLLNQPDAFLVWWADPEKEYVNSILGEQLRSAIEQLPEVFRVTVLLINVDGLSYDEASVVLGIPRGTVRSRMNRGRTLLQKALWMQAQEAGLYVDGFDNIGKTGE